MKLKHLAATAAVGAALAGANMPANAIIQGAAGEANLVPLVIYDSTLGINTIIQVTIPGSIGLETVPNDFTALNTAPTNADRKRTPVDQDLGQKEGDYGNQIHWAFFDKKSKHVCNNSFPVSPNDFAAINWGDIAPFCNGNQDGVPGYMVLTNFNTWDSGGDEAAEFAFFAEAYLFSSEMFEERAAKIPVLPMADGADAVDCVPTPADSVCYDGNEMDVSPLISGMRTNASNGEDDTVFWDLTLSTRDTPTLLAIWMDRLFDEDGDPIAITRSDVYDSHENSCSGPTGILHELTLLWVKPLEEMYEGMPNTSLVSSELPPYLTPVDLCDPSVGNSSTVGSEEKSTADFPGFILMGMKEPIDSNIDAPESAGVAWSIQFDVELGTAMPNVVPTAMAFGHERGLFAN
jgi:hypothetical protein